MTEITNGGPDRRTLLSERLRLMEEKATRAAERSLHAFIRQAWHTVEPARPFRDNWHIGAVAEHLEAVYHGQIQVLVINQPPATTKSLSASVLFPSWVWAKAAHWKFLCSTHGLTLSIRDNTRMRDCITSEWYASRWPIALREDMNAKTRFGNTAGGWRIATSIGGAVIGEHPNCKIVDDPNDPKKQLLSDAEIQQAVEFYDFRLKTRGAMLNAATVLMMQRLHEKDLSGHVLATVPGVVHLCLPMRWEPKRMVASPIGWKDPRDPERPPAQQQVVEPDGTVVTEAIPQGAGALLWPREWPEEKVNATFAPGTWGDAGQFQQRPAPAGGLMFKREWFRVIEALPAGEIAWVRSWDVAGTELQESKKATPARTAGVKMGRAADGRFIIADVRKGWWSDATVDREMKLAAQVDGYECKVREEQEGGSSGKAVTNAHRRMLAGYDYKPLPKRVDKVTAARPLRSQAEVGNVYLLIRTGADGKPDQRDAIMAKEFLDEIELFPAGGLKDQVDAASQAVGVLTGVLEPLEITTGAEAPDSELTPEEAAKREADRKAEAERAVADAIAKDGVYWPGGGR